MNIVNKRRSKLSKVTKPAVTLRAHQIEALDAIKQAIVNGKGSTRGRVIMPTGAGKTFVQAAALDYQRANNSRTMIHLVLAPRIGLTNQLIEEYRNYSGPEYRAIAFHSGKHEPDYEQIKWQETATTKTDEVVEAYRKAQAKGQDLVVFSTYHSCKRLALVDFDTIIADESQYLVAEGFHEDFKTLTGRVRLCFTATEKHTASDIGRGLNNEAVYGPRLYYISPAELIQLGLIVAPRLHVMYGETRGEDASIIDEVLQLALEQDKLTSSEMGFSKILFAMKGTNDVKTIIDNLSKIRSVMPNHDVFAITSKTGSIINGVKVDREHFMRELKSSTRKNVLVFHYDILSEGIDVDGITGVAIMRNMTLSKLLQTIGRAVRIYKPQPGLKRQAWVSVPVLNGNEDDKANVEKFVRAMRNGGYDITKEDIAVTGNERHTADITGLEAITEEEKSNYSSMFIEEVFHTVENNEFWDNVAAKDNAQLINLFA
jgi:superfamily II DNA or RNA helicase